MKHVRLFTLAAAMLIVSQLLLAKNGPTIQARVVTNTQLNLTLPRASSSLAIDTYGYYKIRVWVDGVLINRRPMDFVEIPQLHAGYRLVDIEVFGRRGNQFISETVYMYPGRWALYSIEPGYYGDMYIMTARQTQPVGYRYIGGRRQSIKVGVSGPYYGGHIHIDANHHHNGYQYNGHQHNGNHPGNGNGYGRDDNRNQGNGRDYNRGNNGHSGNQGNNGVRDHGEGRGRGNGNGNGNGNSNGNNGVRDHGQGNGNGNGQGRGNSGNNGGDRRGN